jgi:hypothetical protein
MDRDRKSLNTVLSRSIDNHGAGEASKKKAKGERTQLALYFVMPV